MKRTPMAANETTATDICEKAGARRNYLRIAAQYRRIRLPHDYHAGAPADTVLITALLSRKSARGRRRSDGAFRTLRSV